MRTNFLLQTISGIATIISFGVAKVPPRVDGTDINGNIISPIKARPSIINMVSVMYSSIDPNDM